MRAIIYNDKYAKPYESAVLAIDYRKSLRRFYVVNPDNEIEVISDIEETSFFPFEQIILIRNSDIHFDDWQVGETISGYKWFIDKIDNLESIKTRCIKHNQEELMWYRLHRNNSSIKTRQDADDFLSFTQHFNYGEITNLKFDFVKDEIILRVVTEYFDRIVLIFKGNIVTNISWNEISYSSGRQIESSKIHFPNSKSICFEFEDLYVYANKLFFRYKITNRGQELLYLKPSKSGEEVKTRWKRK